VGGKLTFIGLGWGEGDIFVIEDDETILCTLLCADLEINGRIFAGLGKSRIQ
jgi:hypothetical protein